MDDDLLAVEVCVPERRGDIDDGSWVEILGGLVFGEDALEHGEAEREESGVVGCDGEGGCAFFADARGEGEHGEGLGGEPFEGCLAGVVEGFAEAFEVGWFVGWFVVADDHAVGVASAHVWFGVVGA